YTYVKTTYSKKEHNKFHLIHDLSFPKGHSINDSKENEFTQWLNRHALRANSNIENAFRLIPIHPDDRFLLGFSWIIQGQNHYFQDDCLAMGLSMSCQLFTCFIQIWSEKMKNHKFMFYSDNSATVEVIKKKTARDPQMMV
ncbi:hypothetical protein MAR_021591, partial [Mya arenaria]